MDYYCHACDKTIKIKSKTKHLQSLTHNEFEKCIRLKHTIQNPDFFDMAELFNEYITDHNKKFDLYFVKSDFKLVSNKDFTRHFQSELENNQAEVHLKRFFITLD